MEIDTATQAVTITPSEVLEYLYCPRFTYFLNVLKIPQYEEKRYKVQKGRQVHQERLQRNKDYLRKKIPMVSKEMNVYLASAKLHLRGVVDEIACLQDGSLAPIDYKYSPYKPYVYRTHKIQIALYGMLIAEAYRKEVRHGYIFYIRQGNRMHTIPLTDGLRRQAATVVAEVLTIIREERLPKKTTYRIRCPDCCYKNICS